jgi:nucleotide-binding universal stress UspA family protein
MYNKFLIPVDGSERSQKAVEEGIKMASKVGGRVTIYHVVPDYNVFVNYDHTGIAYKSFINELERQGREILEDTQKKYSEYGVITETKLARGNPVQEICNEAKEGCYDIIVMGSRGLGDVFGFFLGSVSSKVVRHADCSVLIIK